MCIRYIVSLYSYYNLLQYFFIETVIIVLEYELFVEKLHTIFKNFLLNII